MQKQMSICTFNTVYCFQFALLVASVMLSIYAKLSSHVLTIRERERESGSKHARNCVYLGKIENSSYYQELESHPMPEYIEALSY